jgi:spore germination cell wall hydrolase CwlJ-like protein
VRIRRPLFVLALPLLSGATPVHAALGIEPRRLPPAATQGAMDTVEVKLPIPELRQAVSNYDPEERDYLVRTIAFEAADEADEGKAAVAHVILNRKRIGGWGDNIKDVVTHPWQFEPWMTRRTEMEKLSPDDPRYQDAARIADAVLTGQTPDPTAGATHFLNPTVVRQRRGGSLPSWARGEGQPIGRHTFYYPNESSAGLPRAALSTGELEDPLGFDTSSQPLTRADCGKAGMLWNEGANVCTDSTSTSEANLNVFPSLRGQKVRGDALAALGESESKSTKSGEAPAAVHKPEVAAMESPREVQTAVPPIPTKPKTAKSPSRPTVSAAKASSKSKLVKSGGSRGRIVTAKSSTKSSVKTASKSSVKIAAKTASNRSLKSTSKRSMTAVKSRRIHAHVAAAYKRGARARSAAATAANPHGRFMKSAQAAGPANSVASP